MPPKRRPTAWVAWPCPFPPSTLDIWSRGSLWQSFKCPKSCLNLLLNFQEESLLWTPLTAYAPKEMLPLVSQLGALLKAYSVVLLVAFCQSPVSFSWDFPQWPTGFLCFSGFWAAATGILALASHLVPWMFMWGSWLCSVLLSPDVLPGLSWAANDAIPANTPAKAFRAQSAVIPTSPHCSHSEITEFTAGRKALDFKGLSTLPTLPSRMGFEELWLGIASIKEVI